MNRSFAALGAATAAAALVLTSAAAPAAAAVHTFEQGGFSTPAHPFLSEACGYPVSFTLSGTWSVVTFLDESGNVVKEIRNLRFDAVLEANGRTVRGWARGPEIRTFDTDGTELTYVELGVVGRHLKGGNVMQKVGRASYALDPVTGELELDWEAHPGEDMALVCAGLDPL